MSDRTRFQPWLHRYAVLVACATVSLLFAGGLVTSTGSGLSVPDWPLSFGQLMPEMRGGVLFEHGHRLLASAVGLLTVGLAVWLHRREPRAWMRKLGYAALVLVVLQGVLGGVTVLMRLPIGVSIAHAGTAELFFALTVAIAVFTSRGWLEAGEALAGDTGTPSLRWLSLATVVAVYAQILLGALVRHAGAGLAIPDFPLAFGRLVPPLGSAPVAFHFAHRLGAVVVGVGVVWTAVRTLRLYADVPGLRRPALLLVALLAWQVYLGALTVWSRKAVMPTTLHLASGALVFAAIVVLAIRAQRLLSAASPPAGIAEPVAGAEATAAA